MRRQTALPPLLFKKNLIFVKKSLPFYRKQAKGSNSTKLLLKNNFESAPEGNIFFGFFGKLKMKRIS